MIEPTKDLEFVLDMVGDLRLNKACMIRVEHVSIIGHYIYKLGQAYPHSAFQIWGCYGANNTFEMNVRWVAVNE